MPQLILFILFQMFLTTARSQSFHFDNKETILDLSISQSPAHWYINIYPNQTNDVNLRWKTYFTTIPNQWNILFDDQTTLHDTIHDLDSADFVLFGQPDVVQKLIIGAQLNGTAGNGTVSFIIYNPQVADDKDTIHFHFNIHKVPVGLDELTYETAPYKIQEKSICLNDGLIGSFCIFDEQGKRIKEIKNVSELNLDELNSNHHYFIQLTLNNVYYLIKIIH